MAQAVNISKRYCCARCYHNLGKATKLHRIQTPLEGEPDRWIVVCTECGGNVADRSVGRITQWFLEHEGAERIARAMEIKYIRRMMDREKQKERGEYHFDPEKTLSELGF
jgi:hypothetical protein